jgi:hypothetical protein
VVAEQSSHQHADTKGGSVQCRDGAREMQLVTQFSEHHTNADADRQHAIGQRAGYRDSIPTERRPIRIDDRGTHTQFLAAAAESRSACFPPDGVASDTLRMVRRRGRSRFAKSAMEARSDC